MSIYIQYHNYDNEGLPFDHTPGRCGIHTKLCHVEKSIGDQVILIFGIGKPRRYYLWDSFVTDKVEPFTDDDGMAAYHASGPGWYLSPPQRLEGRAFDAFRKSCANFVGFRKVDDLPFAKTLIRVADRYRLPKDRTGVQAFVQELQELLSDDSERKELAAYFSNSKASRNKKLSGKSTVKRTTAVDQKPWVRALSIRQPHAEAIMRGVKKIEYRSGPTKIRGRIHIYASLGRYPADEEAEMMAKYGIDDESCDDLPRGVIIGTVELFHCDGGNWHVRNSERASKLRKPKNHPQPVWFRPF